MYKPDLESRLRNVNDQIERMHKDSTPERSEAAFAKYRSLLEERNELQEQLDYPC